MAFHFCSLYFKKSKKQIKECLGLIIKKSSKKALSCIRSGQYSYPFCKERTLVRGSIVLQNQRSKWEPIHNNRSRRYYLCIQTPTFRSFSKWNCQFCRCPYFHSWRSQLCWVNYQSLRSLRYNILEEIFQRRLWQRSTKLYLQRSETSLGRRSLKSGHDWW